MEFDISKYSFTEGELTGFVKLSLENNTAVLEVNEEGIFSLCHFILYDLLIDANKKYTCFHFHNLSQSIMSDLADESFDFYIDTVDSLLNENSTRLRGNSIKLSKGKTYQDYGQKNSVKLTGFDESDYLLLPDSYLEVYRREFLIGMSGNRSGWISFCKFLLTLLSGDISSVKLTIFNANNPLGQLQFQDETSVNILIKKV